MLAALLIAALTLPGPTERSKKEDYVASKAMAGPSGVAPTQAREVVFARNLHTQEIMPLDGLQVAPASIDAFLRCWFTQDTATIPEDLVARVLEAAHHFGVREVQIISGFRHPKYNKLLRKKGREVAKKSQHTQGHAVDFRLVGVPTSRLRSFVRGRHDGGVGYYPSSGFIHVDSGPKRSWRGT